MAYKWGLFGRVFIVRWIGGLTPADLPSILRDIVNARRTQGEGIIYVTAIPEDAAVPTSEQREALKEFVEKLTEHCTEYHTIFEGNSIKHSIQRTVISGVMMVLQRNTFVHRTVEEALKKIASRNPGVDASALLVQARLRGLIVT